MKSSITLQEISPIDFNDLDWEAELGFRIETDNKTYNIGHTDRVYTPILQEPTITTFNVTVKQLKKEEYDRLIAILELLKVRNKAFPFNDISDNYVFNWSRENARQIGTAFLITGIADNWQIVKEYEYDNQTAYRIVPYIPAEALVQVRLDGVLITLGGAGNVDIDRGSGVLIDNGSQDLANATTIEVETDLYYIKGTLQQEVSVSTYYDYGVSVEAGVIEETIDPRQLWQVSFQIREEIIEQPLERELNAVPSAPSLTEFSLQDRVAGLTQTFSSRIEEYMHHGLSFREDNTNLVVNQAITIPDDTLKHTDLMVWITIYRATQGGGFELI